MNDFSSSIISRARAAYLGLAIGDALGATTEFMTPNEIHVNHKIHKNIVGGGWLKLKAGRVTDDTEMSLALGNAIVLAQRIDARIIAESFSAWMRSKPVDIGNTVRRGIVHYRNSGETRVKNDPYNAGNGACMRALPIALVMLGADVQLLQQASRVQAHITHNSELSDLGTEHVLQLVQMALQGCSLSELDMFSRQFARRHQPFSFTGKPMNNPGGFIVETLIVVLQALYSTESFEDCLIDVVNRGGDADTTGAIAGMIAGAVYGMRAIPKRWLKQIDGQVMADCLAQADALMAMAPLCATDIDALAEVADDASSFPPTARSLA